MHELSIAMGIVESLEAELAGEKDQVVSVGVEIGVLSGVVPDALTFAWSAACQGSILEGSELEITEVGLVVHCDSCNADVTLPTIDRLRCPVCDDPTPEIVAGRELRIRDVRLRATEA